jgi:hypothetical protein
VSGGVGCCGGEGEAGIGVLVRYGLIDWIRVGRDRGEVYLAWILT